MKKKLLKLGIVVLALFVLAGLTGCGSSDDGSNGITGPGVLSDDDLKDELGINDAELAAIKAIPGYKGQAPDQDPDADYVAFVYDQGAVSYNALKAIYPGGT
jgi:hypothetical protein